MEVESFLKIDQVDGESTDAHHVGQIDLLGFNWAESQSGSAPHSGRAAGKVATAPLHCTARVSKASPRLMEFCAAGKHVNTAELSVRKVGASFDFLRFKLTDVVIASYRIDSDPVTGSLPVDQFTLGFGKIEQEYTQQKADGTAGNKVTGSWDLKKNSAA